MFNPRSEQRACALRIITSATLAICLVACGGGGSDTGSRSGVSVTQAIARTNGSGAAAPGELVKFQASCQGSGSISYRWDPGDGSPLVPSTGETFEYSYAKEGEYLPRVVCTDIKGSSAVSSGAAYLHIAVPVHTVTAIAAAASAASGPTTEVSVSATCVGSRGDSTLQYAWSFGDGGTGQGPRVTHSYLNSRPGQYTAVLSCTEAATRTGLAGQSIDASQTVTASTTVLVDPVSTRTPQVTRALTVDPYIPTTAAPAVFSMECAASNGGTISYQFDFGDGSPVQISASGTVSHLYAPLSNGASSKAYAVKGVCSYGSGWVQAQDRWISVREPEMHSLAGRATLGLDATGVAVDASGNVYVADFTNNAVRKISPARAVTILAGGSRGLADGSGASAQFNFPQGVAVDSSGTVYVADTGNHAIRKITPAGNVSTLAGGTLGTANGMGGAAQFKSPKGVTVDSSGNVYVADRDNHAIRKITPEGVVSTLAGGALGAADGTGSAAQFNSPTGIAVDSSGSVYVADFYNYSIRKITATGVVSTLARGSQGAATGAGDVAQFYPAGVAVDSSGTVYVADMHNNAIRKINSAGVLSILAGGSWGMADGVGSAAQFNSPNGIAVDSSGNAYVADWLNQAIRKITPEGAVSTLAGGIPGAADGTGSAAQFRDPRGVALDSSGNVYVVDYAQHSIRKITPAGVVSTLAGGGGSFGAADGVGSAAQFNGPSGVAVDGSGNIYVADTSNQAIRKITAAGLVTTLTGGSSGAINGVGNAAKFYPSGVATDGNGNVFVSDDGNHAIHKISPEGEVSTLAGGSQGATNDMGSAAQFNFPRGVAVDSGGNVYVADTSNHAIRKITSAGVVSTLAGGSQGTANGTGSAAQFTYPVGVAVDSSGNVYVADSNSYTLRKITPAGVVSTVAGNPGAATFQAGSLPGSPGEISGIAISGRRLVFSTGSQIAQIDFAP